jgi:hypothetical protein
MKYIDAFSTYGQTQIILRFLIGTEHVETGNGQRAIASYCTRGCNSTENVMC